MVRGGRGKKKKGQEGSEDHTDRAAGAAVPCAPRNGEQGERRRRRRGDGGWGGRDASLPATCRHARPPTRPPAHSSARAPARRRPTRLPPTGKPGSCVPPAGRRTGGQAGENTPPRRRAAAPGHAAVGSVGHAGVPENIYSVAARGACGWRLGGVARSSRGRRVHVGRALPCRRRGCARQAPAHLLLRRSCCWRVPRSPTAAARPNRRPEARSTAIAGAAPCESALAVAVAFARA